MQLDSCGITDVCLFLNPEIKWAERRGKSRRKAPISAGPSGCLFDLLFEDWTEGRRRTTQGEGCVKPIARVSHGARLRGPVEKELSKEPLKGRGPNLTRLSRLLFCDRCAAQNDCTRFMEMHIPGEYGFSSDKPDPLSCAMVHHKGSWRADGYGLRRAIILLETMGKNGQRPGGYFAMDIRRIAGVSESYAQTVIDSLCKRQIVRRHSTPGRRRYLYVPVDERDNHRLTREIARSNDEIERKFVRNWVEEILDFVTSCKKGEFREGRDYSMVFPGFIIGAQPPEWFSTALQETISEFMTAASTAFNPADEEEELSRPETNSLRKKVLELTHEQRREWWEFCARTHGNARETNLFIMRLNDFVAIREADLASISEAEMEMQPATNRFPIEYGRREKRRQNRQGPLHPSV